MAGRAGRRKVKTNGKWKFGSPANVLDHPEGRIILPTSHPSPSFLLSLLRGHARIVTKDGVAYNFACQGPPANTGVDLERWSQFGWRIWCEKPWSLVHHCLIFFSTGASIHQPNESHLQQPGLFLPDNPPLLFKIYGSVHTRLITR